MAGRKSKPSKLEKLYRYFFLYFVFTLTIFISGFIINFLQLLIHVTIKPYNVKLFRKINYYLCYSLYSQNMFLVEWYGAADIIVYMDEKDKNLLGKEHAYLILNHKYEIDWMIAGVLAEKCRILGNFKAYMKKTLQYMPAMGWALYFSENVFLQRSFDKDKIVIQKQISKLMDYPDPVWLVLYPEGTRFTPVKYESSLQISKEKGLPQLKYHLSPRTRGFVTSLPPMENKMKAIYDVTITFDPEPEKQPTIQNLFAGKKVEAHIYVKRIPFEEVPKDEEKASKFIHDIFIQKDKLQESFLTTGSYFATSGVKKVVARKMHKSWNVFFNYMFWVTLVDGTIFYYLIKLLFTGSLYNILMVFGGLFVFSFTLSRFFGVSETNHASTYGVKQKNIPNV